MNIEAIKFNINEMIKKGTVSKSVLELLINSEKNIIPVETILWDYKLKFDDSPNGYKRTLKSIVSFYNTHGGYIIYGIEELVKDTEFTLRGVNSNQIDQQKLRGQFDKHFGKRIPLVYQEIDFEINNKNLIVGLLYIPKRAHSERSLAPTADASDEKVRILEKNAIYYRTEDECKQVVSTDDFMFISSERNFGEARTKNILPKFFVENNLPDKAFICPKFVGRFSILEELWAWLADELQHSKVLAADGGKGKTSIAYEFCQLLITAKVEGIEQIIWLTAKSKQFKAIFNEYINTPETHFSDIETLLKEICYRTGSLSSELVDLSITQLTKLAKDNLKKYPSFIVIDDVDSNSPEEQKRILEVARTISSDRSKILLTTRVNSIYSMDSSILVPGIFGEEYKDLVHTLCNRFNLPILNEKNIIKLEKSSEGSPLFTESILRLFKQGSSIESAITEWDKKSGEAVREAVLKKEVSELSLEAKKILVTVCTVGTCSRTELHQLTDLEYIEIGNALQELDLLFLVNSVPFIESEPRFESSSSISNLTISLVNELLPEAKHFLTRVRKVYHGLQSNSKKYHPRVGEVVRQCNALIKSERYDEARETLKAIIEDPEFKENKDLFYLSASIEYADPDSDQKVISNSFQTAYIKGQRKQQFFEQWYDYSIDNESNTTSLDICDHAIKAGYMTQHWVDRFVENTEKILPLITNINKKIELLSNAYHKYVSSKSNRSSGKTWETFKSKCQVLIEQLCQLLDQIDDQASKYTIIIFALKNRDISSFTCNQLIDISRYMRSKNESDVKTLDEIFTALSNTIDILNQQESPRTSLIKSLNDEILELAKGTQIA